MRENFPPRGHTSIYLCQWWQDNWDLYQQYISAKGFSSNNQYINATIVDDIRKNAGDVLNSSFRKGEPRWDFYQPVPHSIRTITNNYTDGQLVDILSLINSWRNLFIMELKRRGHKL